MAKPMILATWSFGQMANRAGWPSLDKAGGALDAVERGCMAVEGDAGVESVGLGGLPDAAGRVTLDGCIMLSPARSAGVACVSGYLHPVSLARRVMEQTPHRLLVGAGAEAFAARCGFERAELLTEQARQQWEKWKAEGQMMKWEANREEADREEARGHAGTEAQREGHRGEMGRGGVDDEGGSPPARGEDGGSHDTVGVLAMDAGGMLAGACSTSGLGFKLPGRVGDSPIIGHGLYVDPKAGAATATGLGELMMGVCASFLAVEHLRMGARPAEAVRTVLERMAESYELGEEDQCGIIVLRPDGQWACGALRAGFKVAVKSALEDRVVEAEPLGGRNRQR